jgi:tetratricopeptide (TPR) repeat protein
LSMLGAALAFSAVIVEVKSPAIVAIVLLACIVVSESQIRFWRNGETLFRHAIAVNPNSWMSWSNLANILADRAPAEAIYDCQQALRINPGDANSWNTLGSILMSQGDSPGAVEAFSRACALAPDNGLYAGNYRRATGSSRN